jgi:hypothetical protein
VRLASAFAGLFSLMLPADGTLGAILIAASSIFLVKISISLW